MKKVLVAEDDEQSRYMLEFALKGRGYEVETAENGSEALDKARGNPPDMIVSDILMPVMDGFTLCWNWKSDEYLKNIPFVFYTATYTDSKDEEFALSLGAECFLVKPQEPDLLIMELENVFKKSCSGEIGAPLETAEREDVFYKQYNEALIRKLEDKMIDLDKVNQALECKIIEHEKTETMLREERLKMQALLGNVPFGMVVVGSNGNFKYINDKFRQMFGYELNDIPNGAAWFRKAYPDPECRHRVISTWINDLENFKQSYTTGERKSYTFTVTCKDGSKKIINFIPVQLGTNETLMSCADITETEKNEETMRQSERKYRTLFESANDAIFLIKDGRITDCNTKTQTTFGCTKEQIIGQSPYGLSPEFQPDGRSSEEKAMKKMDAALSSQPQFFEWKHLRNNGIIFDAEVSLNRIELGGELFLQAIIRDITDRKQAEESLKQSEERYRSIFENSIMGIFQTTADGRFLSANTAMAHMYGYDLPEELIAAFSDIEKQLYVHPEDRHNLKKILAEKGIVEGFESRHYKRDGSTIWTSVNTRTVFDADGNILYYEGISKNITHQKEYDENLVTQHQKLMDIIEFLPDATFVIDREKCVIAWNKAIEDMTGIKKEDILGKGDYAYAIPFYGQRRPITIDLVFEQPDVIKNKYDFVKKIGSTLYVEVFVPMAFQGRGAYLSGTASPLYDVNGQLIGAIESIRDITDHKNLQSQLLQSQKMEAIGKLAGGVSHDFNNILSVIIGYCNLLQLKMGKHDPLIAYVNHIFSASEKASSLISTLLTFSRKHEVRLWPNDLNTTIKGAEKLLQGLLTEDIKMKINLSHTDLVVMADSTQIYQVLMNLATNARDVMPDGGTLSISTGLFQVDTEFIKAFEYGEPGRYALITVSDTGSGMDEKTKEKIFEPFFTTKEVGKGTGLGLSTVYGIIKQHSGFIKVYSELRYGTTFKIYLPLVQTEAEKKDAVKSTAAIKGGRETLIVAEDNKELRYFMVTILKQYGYVIIEAVDGKDAAEKFEKHGAEVSLIIVDAVMPGMNGREVYERAKVAIPGIKVLFTSGYSDEIVREKGLVQEDMDFISKPIVPDIFLGKVREILDRTG